MLKALRPPPTLPVVGDFWYLSFYRSPTTRRSPTPPSHPPSGWTCGIISCILVTQQYICVWGKRKVLDKQSPDGLTWKSYFLWKSQVYVVKRMPKSVFWWIAYNKRINARSFCTRRFGLRSHTRPDHVRKHKLVTFPEHHKSENL